MPDNDTAVQTFKSKTPVTWCPGCGDFSVLHAVYKALGILGYNPHETAIISGIGCSGRFPVFTTCYGFHGVHGRLLPTATGVKLANPKLHVFGIGGDGDGLAIGGGHFPHAARRNVDMTYIMLDNSIYGLTKGQNSPTTGEKTMAKGEVNPINGQELNPINLALTYNAGFVARGFSGHLQNLIDLIVKAAQYKGFSFLHVLSPCVVFNNTYPIYNKRVEDLPASHDIKDKEKALKYVFTPDKVFLGVFYQSNLKEAFSSRVAKVKEKAQLNGPGDMNKLLDSYR